MSKVPKIPLLRCKTFRYFLGVWPCLLLFVLSQSLFLYWTYRFLIPLHVLISSINPSNTKSTKWSNTLKNLPTNCLSVFDHFVELPLKGLNKSFWLGPFYTFIPFIPFSTSETGLFQVYVFWPRIVLRAFHLVALIVRVFCQSNYRENISKCLGINYLRSFLWGVLSLFKKGSAANTFLKMFQIFMS